MPESGCPEPKNLVRASSCITGWVNRMKMRMSIAVVSPRVKANPFTVASARTYRTTAARMLIDLEM